MDIHRIPGRAEVFSPAIQYKAVPISVHVTESYTDDITKPPPGVLLYVGTCARLGQVNSNGIWLAFPWGFQLNRSHINAGLIGV